MQPIKVEITASVVAWYGAILATLSAIKVGRDMINDRSRLKITYQTGMRILGGDGGDYFSIKVTSKSKRTTKLTHVGMRFLPDWDRALLLADEQPRTLTDENPSTTYAKPESAITTRNPLWLVYVIDARGREYHYYARRFGRLKWWQYQAKYKLLKRRPRST